MKNYRRLKIRRSLNNKKLLRKKRISFYANSIYNTKKYSSPKFIYTKSHIYKILNFYQNNIFLKKEDYFFYKININIFLNLLYFNKYLLSNSYKNETFNVTNYLFSKNDNFTEYNFHHKIESYFTNHIMKEGKKNKALKNFALLLEYIKNEKKTNPYLIFFEAIENITPSFLPKKKRKISNFTKAKKSIRWIFEEIKNNSKNKSIKKNKKFFMQIAKEIFKAFERKGTPFQKKTEMDLLIFSKTSFSHKRKKRGRKY